MFDYDYTGDKVVKIKQVFNLSDQFLCAVFEGKGGRKYFTFPIVL